MSSHQLAVLLALIALALVAASCGGDDDESDATTAPEISVPSGQVQTVPEETTTTNTTPKTTTAPPSGGTQAPSQSYDPSKPDSPQNDVPPKPGTPEAAFEQYCRENPGACGN